MAAVFEVHLQKFAKNGVIFDNENVSHLSVRFTKGTTMIADGHNG
jgi:hypothetical protein